MSDIRCLTFFRKNQTYALVLLPEERIFDTMSPMLLNRGDKILFVASEAAPFVKVGGLGEVIRSLPKALRGLGFDVRVMLPKYASIDTSVFKLNLEKKGVVPFSNDNDKDGLLVSNILSYTNEVGQKVAYFVENQEYYEKRANVYGYGDDTLRWVLLTKCTLDFLAQSDWVPNIIVSSDWQTGFLPNLLHTDYKSYKRLAGIASVFSIHNLYFQGLFDRLFVSEMDFDAGQKTIPDFFDPYILKLNGMRRGIMYADAINTVSATYAKEILIEEFGEGLDKLLLERRSRLVGILNGIDKTELDPATDNRVPFKYSIKNPQEKIKNKTELQKRFGLPEDPEKFVIGIVSRMETQKGFELITSVVDSLIKNIDFQLIILGDGASEYKLFFNSLIKKYPDRVGGHLFFDGDLPRLIFAGADSILIPSRFEPSGLVQMEAMRYGVIPIVRRVGGLADSVEDFNPSTLQGNGFVFNDFDPLALTIAIVRAYETYKHKDLWSRLIKQAMSADFSWQKSAQEYLRLFEMALKNHQSENSKKENSNHF